VTYKTHILGGIASGVISYQLMGGNIGVGGSVPLFIGCYIGSLLPDVDHSESFLGRKTFGLFSLCFKHRGFTHSLTFASLFLVAAFFTRVEFVSWLLYGFFLGISSHILLDMLNPQGVTLFAPFFKKRIRFAFIKIRIKTFWEYLLGFSLFGIIILNLYNLFVN
jgi:inner membrane protein